MKKIFNILLSISIFLQCSSVTMATNEKNQEEVTDVMTDNDFYKDGFFKVEGISSLIHIDKQMGDIRIKIVENNGYLRHINTNRNISAYLQEVQGEVMEESVSGWGIFLPNVDSIPYSLRCPIEFKDEHGVDKIISVDHGVKENYIIGFTDELSYFIEDSELMDSYNTEAVVNAFILLLCYIGAISFGNSNFIAKSVIKTHDLAELAIKVKNLIKDMAEEQDNMAFYYIELSKRANK